MTWSHLVSCLPSPPSDSNWSVFQSTWRLVLLCHIGGSHSGICWGFRSLRYGSALLGEWFPTFRRTAQKLLTHQQSITSQKTWIVNFVTCLCIWVWMRLKGVSQDTNMNTPPSLKTDTKSNSYNSFQILWKVKTERNVFRCRYEWHIKRQHQCYAIVHMGKMYYIPPHEK
jgi:hypothetical protein